MNSVTTSKKTISNDLVTISRKEYEAWLEFKKIKDFKPISAQKRALRAAENNLKDPDAGLKLTKKAQERLRLARRVKKGKPLSDIIKKYY
ncbi:MAG: hypothetical protein AAB394_02385 [Patescibacteria group bacterium]